MPLGALSVGVLGVEAGDLRMAFWHSFTPRLRALDFAAMEGVSGPLDVGELDDFGGIMYLS